MSKTWLDDFIKSAVSEQTLQVKMLKGVQHLWNQHESTFIMFFHHSEANWFKKYLP